MQQWSCMECEAPECSFKQCHSSALAAPSPLAPAPLAPAVAAFTPSPHKLPCRASAESADRSDPVKPRQCHQLHTTHPSPGAQHPPLPQPSALMRGDGPGQLSTTAHPCAPLQPLPAEHRAPRTSQSCLWKASVCVNLDPEGKVLPLRKAPPALGPPGATGCSHWDTQQVRHCAPTPLQSVTPVGPEEPGRSGCSIAAPRLFVSKYSISSQVRTLAEMH